MHKTTSKSSQIQQAFTSPVAASIGIILLCTPLLAWCLLDNSIWPWDQSWYGAESVRAFKLLHDSPLAWLENLFTVFGTRAPLIVWLGQFLVPVGFAIGKVESGLLLLCVTANFLTLWCTYKWVSRVQNQGVVSITAIVFMACGPLFVGMAQQYFVESLQLCAAGLFYYILYASRKENPVNSIGMLIGAAALGMGVKASTPLYVLIPGILILGNIGANVRKWKRSQEVYESPRYGLLIVNCLFAFLVLGWYVVNTGDLITFVKSASSGEMALLYGSEKTWFGGVLYWSKSLTEALLPGSFGWAWLISVSILGVFSIVAGKGYVDRSESFNGLNQLALAGLLQAALIISVFAFQTNEETRYLLPILPSLVPCLTWLLTRSRSIIPVLIVLAISAAQWTVVHAVSFNWIEKPAHTSVWLTPLQKDRGKKNELAAMDNFLQHQSLNNKYVFCLVDLKEFNHSSLNFIRLTRGYLRDTKLIYSLPVWAGSDWEVAASLITSEEIRCPFVLTMEKDLLEQNVDAWNQTAMQLSEWVASNPDFSRVDFPNSQGIVIYQNIRFYPKDEIHP